MRNAAVRTGLAARRIEDLLIAVSEVATNAIQYAGGCGSITVRSLAGRFIVEICDTGPGLPASLTAGGPLVDLPEGSGLWSARVLCEELHVLSSPVGVTVRMFILAESHNDCCGSHRNDRR